MICDTTKPAGQVYIPSSGTYLRSAIIYHMGCHHCGVGISLSLDSRNLCLCNSYFSFVLEFSTNKIKLANARSLIYYDLFSMEHTKDDV